MNCKQLGNYIELVAEDYRLLFDRSIEPQEVINFMAIQNFALSLAQKELLNGRLIFEPSIIFEMAFDVDGAAIDTETLIHRVKDYYREQILEMVSKKLARDSATLN